MLSLNVNVFAAEPLTDDPNMIEWKYTVFADESLQKVVEEGVIPNAYARYTWRGITLKNGEVAILTPSNNSMGLYCNSGRYIRCWGQKPCYSTLKFYTNSSTSPRCGILYISIKGGGSVWHSEQIRINNYLLLTVSKGLRFVSRKHWNIHGQRFLQKIFFLQSMKNLSVFCIPRTLQDQIHP